MTSHREDARQRKGEKGCDSTADDRQLQTSLKDILDTLPSMIARVDQDGRIDLVNRRLEQFSGISAASARGARIESLIPRFGGELRQLGQAIEQGAPVSIDRIQLRSGRELRYYSLLIHPLDREFSGMAVICIDDITEQVRIQETRMRTEKMTMAGNLAAGLAHEINNPLGVIMQHAQNIERRISLDIPANQEAADELGIHLDDVRSYLDKRGISGFLGHIREAGARASQIVAALLHFSLAGEPFSEAADLAAVIDQALELASRDHELNAACGFERIEIVREYEAGMPAVTMTVSEMEQVFLNIIRNAAQAMAEQRPDHAGRITLRVRRDRDLALIEIEDNGPGLEEVLQQRIFEPFFTTKPVGAGAGLGLAVSYAIVTKNHGGRIEFSSQAGQGTRCTIGLPIAGQLP